MALGRSSLGLRELDTFRGSTQIVFKNNRKVAAS